MVRSSWQQPSLGWCSSPSGYCSGSYRPLHHFFENISSLSIRPSQKNNMPSAFSTRLVLHILICALRLARKEKLDKKHSRGQQCVLFLTFVTMNHKVSDWLLISQIVLCALWSFAAGELWISLVLMRSLVNWQNHNECPLDIVQLLQNKCDDDPLSYYGFSPT